MGKGDKIPDAWDDDDWEAQADRAAKEGPSEPEPQPQVPLTRAERLAKHAEEQRKLWESAETPEQTPFFPPPTNPIPLAQPFKPAVKLLSRKPAPQVVARRDPVTGLEQVTLQHDDEEEETESRKQETPDEMRKRLEEKQRRYEEARAKIFGDSNPPSGQSTPRTSTPPAGGSEGRQGQRGRGRGRGGRGRDQDNGGRQDRRPQNNQQQQSGGTRELFDPGCSPKPGFNLQKRGDAAPVTGNRANIPREEDQIIRSPREPDGSGRGFGFARRGGEHG